MQTQFSHDAPEAQAFAIPSQPHKAGELTDAQVGALRELTPYAEHWFCWGPRQLNDSGAPKAPINPHNGRKGATSDPTTAGTFDLALAQVKPRGYGRGGGVGVHMRTAAADLIGLDLDGCRNPDTGELDDMGAEFVRRFAGTYLEISPSGCGLRAFCRGAAEYVPPGVVYEKSQDDTEKKKKKQIEVHPGACESSNYLRATGALIEGNSGKVAPCQEGLDWVAQVVSGIRAGRGGGVARNDATSASNPDAVKVAAVGDAPASATTSASSTTFEGIKAQVQALADVSGIGAVEAELCNLWNPDAEEVGESAAQVVALLKNYPTGRPGLGAAIKRLKAGNDDSEDDHAICCAAVRRGALTVGDVASVLVTLAGAGGRDKVKARQDYRERTAENALRAVLAEVRAHCQGVKAIERPGTTFKGWHFVKGQPGQGGDNDDDGGHAWTLPEGLAQALATSGDVLALGKAGRPISSDANAVVILRNDPEICGLLGFDEFQQTIVRTGGEGAWAAVDRDAAKGAGDGPINDDDAVRVSMWLQRRHGLRLRHGDVVRAVEAAARGRAFNPLTQRLDELAGQWDGVERVNDWLTRWAMADAQGAGDYVAAAGRCFLVSAVARAFQPGCKVDTVLTLEGAPGGGKSTLFSVLTDAVAPNLFSDGVHDASTAAAIVEGTGGRWIVELAELAAVRRAADVEALKASLSRKTDNYRRPYDTLPRDYPRQFVFVATTNKSQYLNDPTGALLRRFMPVLVKSNESEQCDLKGLALEAGQLWGEAVHLYRRGAKWTIDASDGPAFEQWVNTRKTRKEDEVFHDEVFSLLLKSAECKDYAKRYSLRDIAETVGFDRAVAGDRVAQAQLADTLRGLGMEKRKAAGGNYWVLTSEGANALDDALRAARLEDEAQAMDDLTC